MQRRFMVWIFVTIGCFVGTTVFGWALNGFIGPRRPNNNVWIAPRPAVAVTTTLPVQSAHAFTAFQPPQPPVGRQAAEFKRPLDVLAKALESRELQPILKELDLKRMAEEEVPLGIYQLRGQNPTPLILQTASQDRAHDLMQLAIEKPLIFPQGSAEIKQIRWSADRQEALIVAKHQHQQHGTRFVRWWMKRDQFGMWKVYDFDFPNTRLRFTAVRNYLLNKSVRDGIGRPGLGTVGETDLGAFTRYQTAFDWLMLAGKADDPAGQAAGQWTEQIASVAMIPYVQAARFTARARQAALRKNVAEVEANVKAIPAIMKASAVAQLAQIILKNAQGQYAEVRKLVRSYRDLVGDDPIAYLEEAKAIAALDGPNAAIVQLRKGLEAFPGEKSLAIEFARRLPPDEREAYGQELARLNRPAILTTAAMLFEKSDTDLLDMLCEGYLKQKPKELRVIEIAVRAKVAFRKPLDAGELLKRLPDNERSDLISYLINQAVRSPTPVDHYTAIAMTGSGRVAYRNLAPYYGQQFLAEIPAAVRMRLLNQVQTLTTAHRTQEPDDPILQYGDAMVHFAKGDAKAADEALIAGLERLTPPTRTQRVAPEKVAALMTEDWDLLRRTRTELLIRTGDWKRAYEELRPQVDTFDQLMIRLAEKKNIQGLEEVIGLHAKADSGDRELIAWRGEVSYLKNDYEATVKYFTQYRDLSGPQNRQPLRMAERLIRSYVRLKRAEDAANVLADIEESFPLSRLFHVLVLAAQGNADGVLAEFDRVHPYNPSQWYSDPDLGPLLRGPLFDRVRQKYPPPVR